MRQKKKPVRRNHQEQTTTQGDEVSTSEVFGRFQLPTPIDSIPTNDIANGEDGKKVTFENSTNDRIDDSNNANADENDETLDSFVNGMPPTLAAIERQIQQHERIMAKRQTRKRIKKLKKSPSKKDAAETSPQHDDENATIETHEDSAANLPEVLIRYEENCDGISDSNSSNHNERTRLLCVCPRTTSDSVMSTTTGETEQSSILWSFYLARTKFVIDGTKPAIADSIRYSLMTEMAIRGVWEEYAFSERLLDSLIVCVKAEWIRLIICTSTSSLDVFLTQNAFEGCGNLPFVQRHSQFKRYRVANCLQQVVKDLFGVARGAPIFSNDKSSMDQISAKHVYKLVDNKNMERYENFQDQHDNSTLPERNFEGLIPTLRPYQAAAVQWMLQRERISHHGDEWKVLWMVLDAASGKTIPLTELADPKSPPPCTLLYCPFTGCIVRGFEEAKDASLLGRNHPIKGGILADQMGLGKTVEVLACVLANQYPVVAGRNDELLAEAPHKVPNQVEQQIEERWVDGIEVGSCICGEVISFSKRSQKNMIAFCEYCEEPMHIECTCIETSDVETLPRLDLRRRFGHEVLKCVMVKNCPCCAMAKSASPIRTRATIIICPPSILDQWAQEIRKHTNHMKVLVYNGVEKESKRARRNPDSAKLLHPSYLADTDIILVSFVALMSDLAHSEENRFVSQGDESGWSSSKLRRRKKYRVVPSPLLSIHFWRVCIDEAQRVEVTTTKAAKMALKLKAEHFWAVSGTPIGHGNLQDLYGLFLFLQLAPFDQKEWFNACLSPLMPGFDDRLEALLHHIFWRSTKSNKSVQRQIGIPEMREERVLLNFSSIERHFYNRQLEKTLQLADNCKETSIGKGKRKSSQLDILSESLHRLRAACCHPQVGSSGLSGGRRKKSRKLSSGQKKDTTNSLASRVMTMEQILDRFIDDARHKCEEAQRIAILHTNGMAALTRLKTEARARGIRVDQTDRSLLLKSGQMYREALDLAQANANPVTASAEATLSGSPGFFSTTVRFAGGKCFPMWKFQKNVEKSWATINYEDTSRRISKVLIRPLLQLPPLIEKKESDAFEWKIVKPTTVTLQIEMAATSASDREFVDCVEVPLDKDWVELDNVYRIKKSKTWRICLSNMNRSELQPDSKQIRYFMGLEIQLYEPQVNSDDLQLLHSLHNSCLSYEAALEIPSKESDDGVKCQVNSMHKQIEKIESIHKEQAQKLHKKRKSRLAELTTKRNEKEKQLYDITCLSKSRQNVFDCWDDGWYNDFLGTVALFGTEAQQNAVFERIVQDVAGFCNSNKAMRFPDFNSLRGLQSALSIRMSKIRSDGVGKNQVYVPPATTADNEFVQVQSARFKCGSGEHRNCMQSINNLSASPGCIEIDENRHCRLCKADWNQVGKICRHCGIGSILKDLKPDSVTIAVLTAIYASIRTTAGMDVLNSRGTSDIATRAKFFFEVLEAEEREKVMAWRMWKTHLDLLNGLDELDSCKRGLRLSLEGENMSSYTEEQLNAIVHPIDIMSQYHDHDAKKAMALGDLRQSKGTLRYLQNQKQSNRQGDSKRDACVVCLQPLGEDCCVLRCGHRFHHKPCFEQILKNSSGIYVQCPMKCRVQTPKSEVMIATTKASNDGSDASRSVKGSYGTKITRIVSDILCIKDKNEKGIVFSQWHDMLDILETALVENNIVVARPNSKGGGGGNKFGDSLRAFHAPDCTVLLLNLKQGAEGLTLVHATHVFMVEPIMNNGLDQQAINRVHRIGQTRQTVVWRYLIQNTIEMKMDGLRQTHCDEDEVLEDSSTKLKKSIFSAGGMDGGFATQAELLEILDGD